MGAYYCDSSALVKRYANETGSLWVRSLTDPQAGHDIFTAHITGIEVVAAMARKTHMGEIAEHDATTAISTFKSHFKTQYHLVLMTTVIVDRAMELAEKHRLRGYDATQLASALAVHTELTASSVSPLVFISADAELNAVARAEELVVQNPNEHL
jgi:predicted nucleic acid-binding protein